MPNETLTGKLGNPDVMTPGVILASGSPRRKDLLQSVGVPFKVIVPDVDERALDVSGRPAREQAMMLARFKGESVARHFPDSLVIAADTLVVADSGVLGKPQDRDDAFRMLSMLQGREHVVVSAIAVFYQGECRVDALETRVYMRPLTDEAVWQYINTGEPMDKAGAYAIQGYGSVLVERIEGCYFNVVGMSMYLLDCLCQELGKRLVF